MMIRQGVSVFQQQHALLGGLGCLQHHKMPPFTGDDAEDYDEDDDDDNDDDKPIPLISAKTTDELTTLLRRLVKKNVELTREVGQKASEQVVDVKRLCDSKVSKAGDLMTGNLLLSADGGNDRLFGCTDLPHGNTFTLVFGDTLNRFHFSLTHSVT